MKRSWLAFVLVLFGPGMARAETIYASWIHYAPGGVPPLTRFDSATPELQEDPFSETPLLGPYSLDFDLVTGQLWGFNYFECNITCPPSPPPVIIDLETGTPTNPQLPGFLASTFEGRDTDIDPVTRELRYFSSDGDNGTYSLDSLQWQFGTPLKVSFGAAAVAHRPPGGGTIGVETYAIGRLRGQPAGSPWYHLVRIGGPEGNPPVSSGEVTVIAPIDLEAERLWFDISQSGEAYLAVLLPYDPPGEENKLYSVDLSTGALDFLGVIAMPAGSGGASFLSGIAAAPSGPGDGILAIPALSPFGAALFALVLALAALVGPLRRAPARRHFSGRNSS